MWRELSDIDLDELGKLYAEPRFRRFGPLLNVVASLQGKSYPSPLSGIVSYAAFTVTTAQGLQDYYRSAEVRITFKPKYGIFSVEYRDPVGQVLDGCEATEADVTDRAYEFVSRLAIAGATKPQSPDGLSNGEAG